MGQATTPAQLAMEFMLQCVDGQAGAAPMPPPSVAPAAAPAPTPAAAPAPAPTPPAPVAPVASAPVLNVGALPEGSLVQEQQQPQQPAVPIAPPKPESIAKILMSTPFRLTIVFCLTYLMLALVRPPFVHDPKATRRSPIEEPVLSHPRAIFWAGLVTAICILIPVALEHQALIVGTMNSIRSAIVSLAR